MPDPTPPLSDEELARVSQAADLPAFEELVRRYETRIYAFHYSRVRNAHDAQELTQTTFVNAYRAMRQFRPRRSFAAWLFTIARHALIDHQRRQGRQPAAPAAAELVDARDPARELAGAEATRSIWELAERVLSADQFHALWLRHEEELTLAEIAGVLRKSVISVKVLLHRARARLQAALATPARQSRSQHAPAICRV